MDAHTAAALAGNAALLSILYAAFGLFVIVGAFALLAAFGEWALGFSLRGFIDNVEARAAGGDVWPGIALLLGFMAILGLDLWLGLR
jgi:hypothetical protein